jgi:AraC-like DNA-binding protein
MTTLRGCQAAGLVARWALLGGDVRRSREAFAEVFRALKDRVRVVVLNASHSRAQAEAVARHIDCAGRTVRAGVHGMWFLVGYAGRGLAEVVRASGSARAAPQPRPSIVAEAMAVIEARCLGPLSLQEVAAAVRRTPAYVTTAVKQATGRTVGAWIAEGRLAEARRRLLATDEYVEVIAERVGYADPSHFMRLFRRHHGVTPAAYRAQHRRAG